MSKLVWMAVASYYLGILSTFYLFKQNDNSWLWIIPIILLVAGILATSVPESIINLEYKKVNKKIFSITILIKAVTIFVCSILHLIIMNSMIVSECAIYRETSFKTLKKVLVENN